MNEKKDTLLKALKTSLEMEEIGYKFYTQTVTKAKDLITKRTFRLLAKDEINHREAIKKFYEESSLKESHPSAISLIKKHKSGRPKYIFLKPLTSLRKGASVSRDQLEAYEFAMNLEKDGYNFYKRCLSNTKGVDAKRLFEFLIGQESEHFALLQKTYNYLKNPEHWFLEEERPIVEGG